MRSDRNPYYILVASKKPEIQQWLERAPSMSEEQIQTLVLKPDLKKAMLYMLARSQQQNTAKLAETLADTMNLGFSPHQQVFEIYQYHGNTRWFDVSARSSMEIKPLTFWGLCGDQMFVNHCFVKKQDNTWLLVDSKWHVTGTSSTINHLNANKHTRASDS